MIATSEQQGGQTDPTALVNVTWTPRKFKAFKRAFAMAVLARNNNGGDSFRFEGHEFLIEFAAFLIEHLNNQFRKEKDK